MFVMPCPTKYSYILSLIPSKLKSSDKCYYTSYVPPCHIMFIRCIFMGLIFHLGQIEVCLPSSRLPSVLNWMCPSNKIPQPLIHCKLQLKFSKATRIKLMMDRVQCSFFFLAYSSSCIYHPVTLNRHCNKTTNVTANILR